MEKEIKLLIERQNKEYTEIENEIKRVAENKQNKTKNYAQERNEAPCPVCGNKEFVQKFRNVVGEISGSMHGNFSLFGGLVRGSISGYTKTLPVLSCRKCENEREIKVWNYVYEKDVFWDFMHDFYFGIDDNEPERFKSIDPFFLERPLGTRRYMQENKNYKYDHFNEICEWNAETWIKAGFKISKITTKVTKKFLFWKWEEDRNLLLF